uniref:Putative HNH endonuclease n=1 Tax=viral metagenome TaxID=1070528 RepID=A0A6M3L7L0_9ZZZZ
MPNVGDIKSAKELGYRDTHRWVYQACEVCGDLRWVQLVRNKSKYTKCIKCSNNDPSSSRRETIRSIWTGRNHTEDSKKKIKLARLGSTSSVDACKAISDSLIGNKRNWQGGKTKVQQAVRTMLEYDNWRKQVFSRDSFTCQWCGAIGVELNAHHRKNLSDILRDNNIKNTEDAKYCDELWDVNNGVTLCTERCHKHTRGELRNEE